MNSRAWFAAGVPKVEVCLHAEPRLRCWDQLTLFAANLERSDGGFCHETVLVKVDGTLSPS